MMAVTRIVTTDRWNSTTQIFGGYGFVDGTLVARYCRDAKILEIVEGTPEMQRMIIGRELGRLEPVADKRLFRSGST